MKKEYLEDISTGQIIDSLPENYPLYKDSGLWQIRSDDFEQIIYSQSITQTFDCFIEDYAFNILQGKYGDTLREVLLTNLGVNQTF